MKGMKIKRMVWAVGVGFAVMMLTSCAQLLFLAAAGMVYEAVSYDNSSSATVASYSSSYSARPVAASYQKAPSDVYTTAQGRLVDGWMDNVWRQCKVRDFDGNGEINCCDKATAFCIKWRQYNNNRIRLCQQQTRSLNHMYVQIWLEGYGWWSVDPCYTASGTHDMKMVWGNLYNRDYDQVEAYWITEFNRYIY